MAVEARRRCGFRKVGGLYLCAGGSGMECGRLPIPLRVCPVCSAGIKQTRGWTWVDVAGLVREHPCAASAPSAGGLTVLSFSQVFSGESSACDLVKCPLLKPELIGRAGLLWIGAQFYPSPADFMREAEELGISRRIAAIPRGFKIGETWILFGHPRAIQCDVCSGAGMRDDLVCEPCEGSGWIRGAFRLFKPQRIEIIVTNSQAGDPVYMADLREKGLSPIIVPDGDPDHRGTVYEDEEREVGERAGTGHTREGLPRDSSLPGTGGGSHV